MLISIRIGDNRKKSDVTAEKKYQLSPSNTYWAINNNNSNGFRIHFFISIGIKILVKENVIIS